jgi:hypothetical protein
MIHVGGGQNVSNNDLFAPAIRIAFARRKGELAVAKVDC